MLLRPSLVRSSVAALALGALACGKEIKQTYSLEIVSTPQSDPFGAASTAILEVNGKEVARTAVRSHAPVSLSIPSLDPMTTASASFAVRAVDAMGKVVAFGRTPEVDVLNVSADVRIFVQP